ncbi:MAG TPA: aminotransferase class I/II-fold pyridoxal phosphate-dependent enzyme, partial [Paracoccaceae bacterium]|nr:aminotransferase class I/II-fold pyridoxal phosphate-dependent enzyme [Paracoccaceae bacterium]
HNTAWRAFLTTELRALGLGVDASEGNFVLARFASEEVASGADLALRDAGIIVRKVGGYGFPEGLRITVGDEFACRRVVQVIAEFLKGQDA